MNTALDQVPQFYSIEPSSKAVDTGQGRTYNQSGITYNQAGYTYGGIYGVDGNPPKGDAIDYHP